MYFDVHDLKIGDYIVANEDFSMNVTYCDKIRSWLFIKGRRYKVVNITTHADSAFFQPTFELKISDSGWTINLEAMNSQKICELFTKDYKGKQQSKKSDEFHKNFTIKKVIFHKPATIVYWNDGTKTVVKAENEEFDEEKGLAMCFAKKALGNKHGWYDYMLRKMGY